MLLREKFDICLILHGCPPSPENVIPKDKRWMNWLEEKLRENGLKAVAPDMPTPWEPNYEQWKTEFEKYLVSNKSLLVGHSCGAAFLVRWLLETGKKVKKLILVAPAKIPENENDKRVSMYNFKLPSVPPKLADEIVIFTSNDFLHHRQALTLYKNSLKPKVIRLENKGHFLIYSMGTHEFPELLEEIVSG